MARQYKRDARGRFASGGGGGSSRPARKAAPTRAGNRLNRDNSGRITGIGRDGATARGGRLKTASGGKRATQTASLKSPGFRSGTIAKGGRGVSGSVARSLAAVKRGRGRGAGPANNVRPTGGRIKSRGAANNIRQVKLNPSSRRTMHRELADSKRKIKAYTRRLMRVQRSYSQARATRLGIEAAAGTPDRMTPAQAKIHAKSVKTEKTAESALREYKRGKTVIKPYRPTTARGRLNQLDRQINRDVADLGRSLTSMTSKIREVRPKLDRMKRQYERSNARHIANRRKRNVDGQVARTVLAAAGTSAGRKAITRRMQRALGAAGRGSKVGQQAVRVYLNQLAGMGPGKPSKGRNNLRPGPRNTKGTPKRRRKR